MGDAFTVALSNHSTQVTMFSVLNLFISQVSISIYMCVSFEYLYVCVLRKASLTGGGSRILGVQMGDAFTVALGNHSTQVPMLSFSNIFL